VRACAYTQGLAEQLVLTCTDPDPKCHPPFTDVKILQKLAYIFTGWCSPGQHAQVQPAACHHVPSPPSVHATQPKACH